MTKQHEVANNDIQDIKILIVDDSSVCAEGLQILLEAEGLSNITIAKTGNDAIKFSEKFDLIFMDFNLPDTDGIKLTQHFRKGSFKTDTPIICCSSITDSKRKECIESGMDDFLSKPPTEKSLQEILECWLPSFKKNLRTR